MQNENRNRLSCHSAFCILHSAFRRSAIRPFCFTITPVPTETPSPIRPRRRAFILFCLLLVIYLANLRDMAPDDTVPTRYLPFSIVTRHSLNVDGYIDLHLRPYLNGMVGYGPYFAARVNGHWMSAYPILTSLVATPVFVVPAIYAEHSGVEPGTSKMRFLALMAEKLSAAILAALGAAIFYLALRRILPENGALQLVFIYAIASPTWNLSAQALWLQNLTELSLVLLIWALITDRGTRASAAWIGLALALAVANKLTNAVVAFPMIAWFCFRELRRARQTEDAAPTSRIVSLFVPLAGLGLFVLWYNFHYFGSILGAYTATFETLGYSGVVGGFQGGWRPFLDGLAGLLISPNRGLFLFVPWTVLSLWGAVRLWQESETGWERWLLAGSLLLYLTYAKLLRWYGGYTFGPRYLVDLMPVFVLCLVPVWRAAVTPLRRGVFASLVVLALAVQFLGVFNYPNGSWNETPVTVDNVPARVWDWHDLELVRVLKAGPAPTHLLDHLRGQHNTY